MIERGRGLVRAASAVLALAIAGSAAAGSQSNSGCKAETASCIRAQCNAVPGGSARLACVQRCRGIGGCAAIRTLAYAVMECRADARGLLFGSQELRIRRGNHAPITVLSRTRTGPVPDAGLCRVFGQARSSSASRLAGVVQRLAVSPDAGLVAFEVTDDWALYRLTSLTPEEKGLFVIGSDGRGLRRLGPPSRARSWHLYVDKGRAFNSTVDSAFSFSPDGSTLLLVDRGPGPAGEDALQVVTVDVATGRRVQVTRLPDAPDHPVTHPHPVTFAPVFAGNRRIVFSTYANPDGLNPGGKLALFTVRENGANLRILRLPEFARVNTIVPAFGITGRGTTVLNLNLPGVPKNTLDVFSGPPVITEVFLLDGDNLLQLTNFGYIDTSRQLLSVDERTAYFHASADPLGTNPTNNCQLFAMDTLGRQLRQLTFFREGERSLKGCDVSSPPGCAIVQTWEDPVTRSLVFLSSCDPFGTNPYGVEMFALHPDGSRLRQLTRTQGFTEYPDGSVRTEFVGPVSYSASPR